MKTKRILACILTVAMLITTISFTAFADEGNIIEVATLEDLENASKTVKDGDTIKLTADVEKTAIENLPFNADVTFDLNNKTLKLNGDNQFYNVTFKNGTITAGERAGTGVFLAQTESAERTMNFENVTFNAQSHRGFAIITAWNKKQLNVNIKNSTFNITDPENTIESSKPTNDENSGEGSFINIASNVNIINSTVTISDYARGFVEVNNVNLDKTSKIKLENNTKSAFRNSGATIAGTLEIYNVDIAIENDNSECVIFEDGSNVTIENSKDKNIVLGENAKVIKAPNANVSVTNTKAEDESANLISSFVAKVGDTYYQSFTEAVNAATDGDTIDLLGNVILMKEAVPAKTVVINKDLTFKNGTLDLTGYGTVTDAVNAIFEVIDGKNVTFEKVNFKGENYYSAFGVIYANAASNLTTVTLKECNFNLTNDGRPEGGILKGNEPGNNSKFVINNCSFTLTDPVRVFANCTIEMKDSNVTATTTGNNLVDNAFRNVYGSISNSKISVNGFENGIKNTYDIGLELKDNTVVKALGSVGIEAENEEDRVPGYDLILKNGANVKIDETSSLIVETVSKDENENTGIYLGDEKTEAYALTFELNGGLGVENKMFAKDTNVNLSSYIPSRSGYAFIGWYSDEALKNAVSTVKLTKNTTVYALWKEIYVPSSSGGGITTTKFTVNFETNGGNEIESVSVARSTKVKEPTAPTKEGYTFDGWYTDKNCTKKYDFATRVKSDFTLYAKWVAGEKVPEPAVNKNAIVLTIGKTSATVFGETKANDVAPIIRNNRTMLPARFVAESLGAIVEWNEELQQVTITKDDITIVITIGSDKVLVNGKEKTIDSPAFIENDRTYTPIRFISEELGAKVEWNKEAQTVTITK